MRLAGFVPPGLRPMLRRMHIGLIGAGAIGGLFAARLALAGHTLSVFARGATLAALQHNGLRLDSRGRSDTVAVRASDDAAALGPQQLLIVAVKAPSLPQVLPAITAMCNPQTVIVPALNGLPWWYFLHQGRRLRSVDVDGAIEAAIPLPKVLGCVVFPACSTPAPGHVKHAGGERIVFGEPAGGLSDRVQALTQLCRDAGFEAEASADVRREVWLKLLGNACFNPVSLITRAHTDTLIDEPGIHALFIAMMEEALGVGRAAGLDVALDPLQRLALTRKLGHVRTSMLQDALAGRPVEVEAILGALLETAQAEGVAVPLIAAVTALARVHAREAGLMPGKLS